mmetsp:Transcript_19572/g.26871  ORF Transcript_19572/g.26871 Transcript_19572/m.26871 type:complete len:224 (-) Transcript_19572:153-824(-)
MSSHRTRIALSICYLDLPTKMNNKRCCARSSPTALPAIIIFFIYLLSNIHFVFAELKLSEELEKKFFGACSGGNAEVIAKEIEKNPEIANAHTTDGESCLHLVSISGSVEVAKILLEAGADPNYRTTWEKGLRMHPLSWNVYGGHYEIVRLLLDGGARVNDDFDLSPTSDEKVTVMDISGQLLQNMKIDPNDADDRFALTHRLLLKKGGKKFVDLQRNVDGEL